MPFEQFCEINVMTESEVIAFQMYLKQKNDDLHERPVQDWLDVFNVFFDSIL